MRAQYLVTGATGLIGKQLMVCLLTRGVSVHVLVRARARHAPLLEAWSQMASRHDGELHVLEGDVTAPMLGLDPAALPSLSHVFHLAAHYDIAADAELVQRVNVGGTENLLALLAATRFAGVLHHVSSVAVAGDHSGALAEDALELGQSHPTPYHQSKHDAERLVRAQRDMRVRIYRPSAVVGDSRSGEMDRVDGPYYLFAPILKLRDTLPRWFPLLGPTAGPVNMVPVDWVAGAIDELSHRAGFDGKTFHLVDPDPPSFAETFNLIADAAGAPRMRQSRMGKLLGWVKTAKPMAAQLGSVRFLREQLMRDMGIPREVHGAFNREVRYDTSNVRAALGDALPCPRQADYVEPIWDYWLRHLRPTSEDRVRDYLDGKNVLVTGASSGIGAALAEHCAAAGAHVTLVARREEELRTVVESIERAGGSADYFVADLSDLDACDLVCRSALARHGHIDVLINNAGRSIRRPLVESLERFHDFERVMQINFYAPLRLIRGLLPSMRAHKRGHIVNILSAGTLMPAPRFGVYTASKAALSQVGDTLAAELADEDILCTAAYLPFVRTAMMDAEAYRDTEAMTPQRAAAWILDGVASRQHRIIESNITRRFVLNQVAPALSTRMLNLVYRIYADDPAAYPELEMDRVLAKRFIGGRPV